jgi:formylglycine-generating enzyme required for sulfatase activity
MGRCVDLSIQSLQQVESSAGCVGGYVNLYDMSGNAAEWENDCFTDRCATRGGSYADVQDRLTCTSVSPRNRMTRSSTIGFRCCF